MTAIGKKAPVTVEPVVGDLFDDVSKAFLVDLCVDLLRIQEGEELDGRRLVEVFLDAARPIAYLRGDERALERLRRRALRKLG
ncbi:MAG: hypothetical protein JSV86_05895 [Gemmatimonadota bacterium]|nr:MAG: hypothetical protein JSV86_05895 [Gemmatimonadota bacterium]